MVSSLVLREKYLYLNNATFSSACSKRNHSLSKNEKMRDSNPPKSSKVTVNYDNLQKERIPNHPK